MEEFDLLGDSKYRSYMTQVDRALKGFDSTSEWADLIAALGKLNKVLLGHMKYPIIPRRIVISKRLAQCMHPALPSGVHLKALETYDIIFKCMGTNRLAAELFIYSAGLFPLLGNAAMNVRSALLTVYENHFVPLGERLRPGLNGLLSGVLPGLEEGSDHYSRTSQLLEAVCDAVDPAVFYSGVWECVATNATIRLPALTFVLAHCSKKGRGQVSGMDHQLHLLGTDHDVMCRALCLALQDSSALVQRAALEFLLVGFHLHNPQFVSRDMVHLVTAALFTLLRRDMSLNRRVFSWLLGTEINPDLLPVSHPLVQRTSSIDGGPSPYFTSFSKQLVIDAVTTVLESSLPRQGTTQPMDIKPYRIITTLLDKPEIGPDIIDHIILDIYRTLYHMSYLYPNAPNSETDSSRQELIKTANLLFAQLDTSYVWTMCASQFEHACDVQGAESDPDVTLNEVLPVGTKGTNVMEMCKLITFLLDVVSIETYVETSSEHLPRLFQAMVGGITAAIKNLRGEEITSCLECCRRVLTRVQPTWNVWEVTDKVENTPGLPNSNSFSMEPPLSPDVAKEATESAPCSPCHVPSQETPLASLSEGKLHEVLVAGCVDSYTTMFRRLVEERILETPTSRWSGLLTMSGAAPVDREAGLTGLLERVLQGVEDEDANSAKKEGEVALELRPGVETIDSAFSAACNGLVELSSMPTYNVAPTGQILTITPSELPVWLQALLVCCTRLPSCNDVLTKLQLTAVSTLVELSSVLKSALSARRNSSSPGGSVLVIMSPLIEEQHLTCIINQTDTLRKLAASLWRNLGSVPPTFHLSCVTLIHRLIDLAPKTYQLESVVARSLQSTQPGPSVCVYRRFARLWHLSRDIPGTRKTLDLCLYKMVAGLQARRGAVRALAERWVEHCLSRGDTGRLLEPILISLLHPSTARVSVLHASIKQSVPTVQDDCSPNPSPRHSKIFAISSTDNNVIYHVSRADPSKVSNRATPSKRVQLVTTSTGVTTTTPLTLESPVSHSRFLYSNMSMWVNPFALVSSESEFNQDPSSTPEPHNDPSSDTESISSDESLSSAQVSQSELCPSHSVLTTVSALIHDLINSVVDQSELGIALDDLTFPSLSCGDESERRDSVEVPQSQVTVHPLHSHLLLYCTPVDSWAILHNLAAIRDILTVHPRLAVSSLATTSVASPTLTRSVQVIQLLARHRRAVFGKGFTSSLPPDATATFRSSMLLEVVVSICLYYLRSFYPSLQGLSSQQVTSNREVQLLGVSLLNKVCSELILVVKDNGKSFAAYMSDLLTRCKVQKVVLHSLLSGVHTLANKNNDDEAGFTQEILRFNDNVGVAADKIEEDNMSDNTEAFQVELLKLVLSLVMLEEVISVRLVDDEGRSQQPSASTRPTPSVMKYHPEHPLPSQPMFLAAILTALKQPQLRELHHHWTGLVVACLPFLGKALTQTVTSVAGQIWANLEALSDMCKEDDQQPKINKSVPSDYVLTQLESLGNLLSYCLLDSNQNTGGVAASPLPSAPHQQTSSMVANLFHVFSSSTDLPGKRSTTQEQLVHARRSLLSMMPRLVVSLASLWNAVSSGGSTPPWLVGSSKAVRTTVLDLLSPVATVHPSHFLAAVSCAWAEQEPVPPQQSSPSSNRKPCSPASPTPSSGQAVLIELVSSLRVFPTATVIATLRQVIKSPPPVSGSNSVTSLDVSALQFFSGYLSASPSSQLGESWTGLKELLKDCLTLRPPSVFLALSVLYQFVVRGGGKALERKETRELQEMTGKLVEATAVIAGSRLEAGTWLRGTRAVRQDLQEVENENTSGDDVNFAKHAVSALSILGKLLSNLLDIVYQSDEKEKVLPLLTTLMYNVTPYLRHHSPSNCGAYRAGSQVLASLSEYQYTRRAWKKEAMELLLDPAFFQMDHESLMFWRTTIDNLMTHDKTTFKELLVRVASLGQSNMSLFSTKEQEQEQRALLLKRLAFVIFCSDVDQYQKQMPDITDRLSECIRTIPPSPAVQAAVFLCFRVILLRMSAVHVTFMWPVIITEMVCIFSHMEQELSSESEEFSSHLKRLSTLDSSWVAAATTAGVGLGLSAHNSPAWQNVYLGVCKLLDQAAALPATLLPQFQMYRWAFVREGTSCNNNNSSKTSSATTTDTTPPTNSGPSGPSLQQHDFVPHIPRIAKLLESKVGHRIPPRPIVAGEPLLTMRTIESLVELGPWFSTLSLALTRQQTRSQQGQGAHRSPVATLERIIQLDFLETLSQNGSS